MKEERARIGKKSMNKERAIFREKPRLHERAMAREKPNMIERNQEANKMQELKEAQQLAQVRHNPLAMLGDASMAVERVRIAAQIRLSHLAKRGEACEDTRELMDRAQLLEEWVDGRLAAYLSGHPAAWWFTHVKGVGSENIAKVISRIEAFGKWYDPGDEMIPPYVHRQPQEYSFLDRTTGETETKVGIWVAGIERLPTPSKLRKLAGLVPGMRKESGKILPYDDELRMLTWRLGLGLMRATGKFYDFYNDYKDYLVRRETGAGHRIVPTPRQRMCFNCNKEVVKKAAKFCPDCGGPLSLKTEPEGVLYQGHLHEMATRRMRQLFMDLLWVAWRKGEGLPLRVPYAVEYGGHSRIMTCEDMMDK